MTFLHEQTGRCGYCPGCDKRKKCVDPLRRYTAIAPFTVDGIHYDPNDDDVHRSPMISPKLVHWRKDDKCGPDCLDFLPQEHSNPPTEAELNRWMDPRTDDGGVPTP